jgi:type VI secretion system secreted protein Hcp
MPTLNRYQLASIAAASILVSYIGASAYMVQTAPAQTVQKLDFPAILAADAASVDYFLKIDGIEGESTDNRHTGQIEIESFSWGASQTGSSASGGGGGVGKANVQHLHFVTKMSKASPKLFLACATGEHIKEAVLVGVKEGKDRQEFFKVTLTDVLVSSFQQGGMSGDIPTDQFSLNFAKIEYEYRPQKADGSLDAPVKVGYDLKASKKV